MLGITIKPGLESPLPLDGVTTCDDTQRCLFLDVATHYTGYAVFRRSRVSPYPTMLCEYGNITPIKQKDSVDMRCFAISGKIRNIITQIKPTITVQEFPTFQGGKGIVAARKGHTLQLARLCGRIEMGWEYFMGKVYADTNGAVKLPPIYNVAYTDWAGQLPKHVTCKRMAAHFGIEADPKTTDNNWADAIMMGKWFCETQFHLPVLKGRQQSERSDL